jgi:hypothetical protein
MRKYFISLSAILIAVIFSSFTKKTTTVEFMLLTAPSSANIANDNSQWADVYGGGNFFGDCSSSSEELACTITLDQTTMTDFFHSDGLGGLILNDFSYANSQNPKKGYLAITESTGEGLTEVSSKNFAWYVVAFLAGYIFSQELGQWRQSNSVTRGTDYDCRNGKK